MPFFMGLVQVVESDKADMDVESFAEGILGSIVVPEVGAGRRVPPRFPRGVAHGQRLRCLLPGAAVWQR